ncbi:MAG: PAS domain S-box protein [Minisyncoccia bacterium]
MINIKKKLLEIIVPVVLTGSITTVVVLHFFIDYYFSNMSFLAKEHFEFEAIIYQLEVFIIFIIFITVALFLFFSIIKFKKFANDDIGIYLLALESASNHIIITDVDGSIVYANKGAQDTTGYSFEEMKGNTPRLWGALMPVSFYKNLWQTIKYDREVFSAEIKNRRKNQEEYYTIAHISPIVNTKGDLTGFVASEEDITSQKQAEINLKNSVTATRNILEDLRVEKEKLSEAKAKDEALLENIGEGVIAINKEGKVILMNNTAEDLLGFNSIEVIGKFFNDAIILQDEEGNNIPEKLRPITSALGTKTTTTTTTTSYFYVRKNGTKFPVAITTTPVILNSEIIGAIDVFRDITKEKAIDRAKSEFASVASHQLRTPLTGIRWTIERILKKSDIPPKELEQLSDIQKLAFNLTEMVDSLLNIARIESSVISVTVEAFDLVGFLNGYLNDFQFLLKGKNLVLSFKNSLKEFEVITDKNTLRNIFQSLLINAIEYTPDNGNIIVSLEKKENTFLVAISDTGVGIPQDEQKSIFGKFFRASNAMSIKAGGTGVGLYIAKEATKLLGGKIWFESELNKGTTFYVEIPLISVAKEGTRSLA